ncbi:MAG TPA: hypothetical protein VI603_05470 [Saprospiraceae bacterium]|nr:hypothetical protein [Saprospiraceae bacterium]
MPNCYKFFKILPLLFTIQFVQGQVSNFFDSEKYPPATKDSVRGFSFGDMAWWNRAYFNPVRFVGFREDNREYEQDIRYWHDVKLSLVGQAKKQEQQLLKDGIRITALRLHRNEFNQLPKAAQNALKRRLDKYSKRFSITRFRSDFKKLTDLWSWDSHFKYSVILNEALVRVNNYLPLAYELDYTILEVLYDFTGYESYSEFEKHMNNAIEENKLFLLSVPNGYHPDTAILRLKDMILHSEACLK